MALCGRMIDLERLGLRSMMWNRYPPRLFVVTKAKDFASIERQSSCEGWFLFRLRGQTLWKSSASISGAGR